MCSVNRAILLLAGRGLRMGSLTENGPKCLLEVGGVSILERALRSLRQCEVSEAILVVGYQSEQIQYVFGHQYAGIDIQYVVNHRFDETNTAYSLWLARDYLDVDCLLLEGDVVFDVQVLKRVLRCSKGRSVWASIPVTRGQDEGVLLGRSENGYIAQVCLVSQSNCRPPGLNYKCAGIQLLTAKMACTFALRLDHAICSGQTRVFADLVLGEVLDQTSMVLCSLDGLRWGEVDSVQDLERVQQLFSAAQERTEYERTP